MIRKIIFIAVAVIDFITLRFWFACSHLEDRFYFSRFDMQLRLDDVIHNDTGVPYFIIHLFHNKLIQTVIDVVKEYILFWDPVFLIQLLSFVGFFGFIYGLYKLGIKKQRRKLFLIWFISISVIQLWILLPPPNPFLLTTGLIAVLCQAVAFYGLWQFTAQKKWYVYIVLLILIAVSVLWIFILPQNVYNYCIKQ